MPRVLTYIGGAGVGKTKKLLDTMSQVIERGIASSSDIGFVSFTRAARAEAAERAATLFNMPIADLTERGWFRTAHSCCYQLLGCKDRLLTPDDKTARWIANAVGMEVAGTGEGDPNNDYGRTSERSTHADKALQLWHLARNTLLPLSGVYDRAYLCNDDFPSLGFCRSVVECYEQAKRLDDRVDFTDILGEYAGFIFNVDGPARVSPRGPIPPVPVWFFDEAQDNTPLLDAVIRRLTSRADIVYCCLDPWQSIHGWMGADSSLVMSWPVENWKILDVSYRCPSKILAAGERQISGCSDYFDRRIRPTREGGTITRVSSFQEILGTLDPAIPHLLLARTNFQARRVMGMIRGSGIPWIPIKGLGGWNAPARQDVSASLLTLQQGGEIDCGQWGRILKEVPARYGGIELFERGTKTSWDSSAHCGERSALNGVSRWGGTAEFARLVAAGEWCGWVDYGHEFAAAQKRWGWRGVLEPKIRVGTIHAAKGMECDRVVLTTAASRPVWMNRQDQRGMDEESRLAYVAVTRAREEVVIVDEHSQYQIEVVT